MRCHSCSADADAYRMKFWTFPQPLEPLRAARRSGCLRSKLSRCEPALPPRSMKRRSSTLETTCWPATLSWRDDKFLHPSLDHFSVLPCESSFVNHKSLWHRVSPDSYRFTCSRRVACGIPPARAASTSKRERGAEVSAARPQFRHRSAARAQRTGRRETKHRPHSPVWYPPHRTYVGGMQSTSLMRLPLTHGPPSVTMDEHRAISGNCSQGGIDARSVPRQGPRLPGRTTRRRCSPPTAPTG